MCFEKESERYIDGSLLQETATVPPPKRKPKKKLENNSKKLKVKGGRQRRSKMFPSPKRLKGQFDLKKAAMWRRKDSGVNVPNMPL